MMPVRSKPSPGLPLTASSWIGSSHIATVRKPVSILLDLFSILRPLLGLATALFANPQADGWTPHLTDDQAMLPADGIVPFLIEWGSACADFTPAATAPRGCELMSLRAEAADPAAAAAGLAAVGIDPADMLRPGTASSAHGVEGRASFSRIVATLRTPKGLVQF